MPTHVQMASAPCAQPTAAASPFAHAANAMLTPLAPVGSPNEQSAAAYDSPVVAQRLDAGSETERAQAATLAAHNTSFTDTSPLLDRLAPGVEPSAHCRLLCIRAVQAVVERGDASPLHRGRAFELVEPVLVGVSRSDSDEAVRVAAREACSALACVDTQRSAAVVPCVRGGRTGLLRTARA